MFASLLLVTVSCEDFLDKNPYDSVSTADAILSVDDAGVALNGMYSGFKSTSYYGRMFSVLPDIQTDEVLSVIGYSNQLGETYKWSFTQGNGNILNMWDLMYRVIVRSSNIINVIDDLEGEASEKNQIKGEALMGRALAHFDLVRSFAKTYVGNASDLGVPIVLEYALEEPSRNTIEQVYAQIITDLTDAKSLMTNSGADSPNFTSAAADALLARIYLYMGNWDKAIEHASNVIGNSDFALLSGDDFLSMWINDTGSEIIWKVALTSNDSDGHYLGYNYYNDAQGKPNPDYMPALWLLEMFDQRDDIRWAAYFDEVETSDGWTYPLVHKYPTNPKFTGGNSNGVNMPKPIRIAEMYLIRAEAYAEKGGNDANAMSDLNTLRAARIDGYTDESLIGNSLKEAIWKERTKELCFEGHRFFDLKRKGLGFTRVPQEYSNPGPDAYNAASSDPRWVWPIPQAELNANSNIEPNPGY